MDGDRGENRRPPVRQSQPIRQHQYQQQIQHQQLNLPPRPSMQYMSPPPVYHQQQPPPSANLVPQHAHYGGNQAAGPSASFQVSVPGVANSVPVRSLDGQPNSPAQSEWDDLPSPDQTPPNPGGARIREAPILPQVLNRFGFVGLSVEHGLATVESLRVVAQGWLLMADQAEEDSRERTDVEKTKGKPSEKDAEEQPCGSRDLQPQTQHQRQQEGCRSCGAESPKKLTKKQKKEEKKRKKKEKREHKKQLKRLKKKSKPIPKDSESPNILRGRDHVSSGSSASSDVFGERSDKIPRLGPSHENNPGVEDAADDSIYLDSSGASTDERDQAFRERTSRRASLLELLTGGHIIARTRDAEARCPKLDPQKAVYPRESRTWWSSTSVGEERFFWRRELITPPEMDDHELESLIYVLETLNNSGSLICEECAKRESTWDNGSDQSGSDKRSSFESTGDGLEDLDDIDRGEEEQRDEEEESSSNTRQAYTSVEEYRIKRTPEYVNMLYGPKSMEEVLTNVFGKYEDYQAVNLLTRACLEYYIHTLALCKTILLRVLVCELFERCAGLLGGDTNLKYLQTEREGIEVKLRRLLHKYYKFYTRRRMPDPISAREMKEIRKARVELDIMESYNLLFKALETCLSRKRAQTLPGQVGPFRSISARLRHWCRTEVERQDPWRRGPFDLRLLRRCVCLRWATYTTLWRGLQDSLNVTDEKREYVQDFLDSEECPGLFLGFETPSEPCECRLCRLSLRLEQSTRQASDVKRNIVCDDDLKVIEAEAKMIRVVASPVPCEDAIQELREKQEEKARQKLEKTAKKKKSKSRKTSFCNKPVDVNKRKTKEPQKQSGLQNTTEGNGTKEQRESNTDKNHGDIMDNTDKKRKESTNDNNDGDNSHDYCVKKESKLEEKTNQGDYENIDEEERKRRFFEEEDRARNERQDRMIQRFLLRIQTLRTCFNVHLMDLPITPEKFKSIVYGLRLYFLSLIDDDVVNFGLEKINFVLSFIGTLEELSEEFCQETVISLLKCFAYTEEEEIESSHAQFLGQSEQVNAHCRNEYRTGSGGQETLDIARQCIALTTGQSSINQSRLQGPPKKSTASQNTAAEQTNQIALKNSRMIHEHREVCSKISEVVRRLSAEKETRSLGSQFEQILTLSEGCDKRSKSKQPAFQMTQQQSQDGGQPSTSKESAPKKERRATIAERLRAQLEMRNKKEAEARKKDKETKGRKLYTWTRK